MKKLGIFLVLCAVALSSCSKKPHNDNPNTATPFFAPSVEEISVTAEISIGCEDDADIYYTTDGTDPSEASTKYSAAFKLAAGNWTLRARAYCSGKKPSDLAIKTYTVIAGTVKPVISAMPPAASYASGQSVTLSSSNSSSDTIYYTTDGSEPVAGASGTSVYSDPISVNASMTIKAFAKTPEGISGDTKILIYSIDEAVVPAPVILPSSNSISTTDQVTISATLGTVTYTIDTADFTNASSYTGPISLTAGTHEVRAIATNEGKQSTTTIKSYVVTAVNPTQKVETPVITVLGSAPYKTTTSIQITSATSGAAILYAVDGGSYQTYSAAFTLAEGYHRILAKATKTGMTASAVTSLAFDIAPATTAVRIYYSGTSAPLIWIWEVSPDYATSEKMGLAWATRPSMKALSGLSGWYYYDIPAANRGTGTITLKFGDAQYTVAADKPWFKNGSWYSACPDVLLVPVITASPVAKTYKLAQNVTLAGSNTSDTIYYTTDGNDPTTSSSKYSAAIPVTSTKTIKAFGVNADGISGSIATFAYIIDPTIDDTAPTINPSAAAGTYTAAQTVKFTVSDDNSAQTRAFYTTDGSAPTESSPVYVSGNAAAGLTGSAFSIDMDENMTIRFLVIDGAGNRTTGSFYYRVSLNTRDDFRKESIYFVITTRFYDGDPTNNVHCWDDAQAKNPDTDPAWRGDFKGLIDKLDYIKALGFSAIWITPPVKNCSGYDYHGYHAINFKEVDPRYKTSDVASAKEAYQKFIDACHAKGIKVIQDIVFNHSSNFGEENLYPLFKREAPASLNDTISSVSKYDLNGKLPANYDTLTPALQYAARINAMKEDTADTARVYHHEKSLSWESYTVQTGQIAGDCVDLNTENPTVFNYLTDAAKMYVDMGVDAFRVDTVKHISRLTFNKTIIPSLKSYGSDNLFIFGEVCTRYRNVWNSGLPAISAPFYTWKERASYAWSNTDRTVNEASVLANWNDNTSVTGQPVSTNAFLNGNAYHTPDWTSRSGFDVIDFPMHWSFKSASDAYNMATGGDQYYSDATWNVVYVDSHDYAPDGAPENQRFAPPQATWAENLALEFLFRGIPCLFYGSEIEFMKGAVIDVGPNAPLSATGRAYFGANLEGSVTASAFGTYDSASGAVKSTLDHPLAKHVARLNLIRRTIPALQKGQYSTDGITKSGVAAFKRRYTSDPEGIDSYALITISGDATFTGIENGTYTEAITGATVNVTNGTLTSSGCSGQGNARIYVLTTAKTAAPGKVGTDGTYLK